MKQKKSKPELRSKIKTLKAQELNKKMKQPKIKIKKNRRDKWQKKKIKKFSYQEKKANDKMKTCNLKKKKKKERKERKTRSNIQ